MIDGYNLREVSKVLSGYNVSEYSTVLVGTTEENMLKDNWVGHLDSFFL
jgi:hypothetical protein